MQSKAWMTIYLFNVWLSYFIESICHFGCKSPKHQDLLIMDGHNFYMSLKVLHEVRASRLDLNVLRLHTSHAIQPLNVCIFKPFKQCFNQYWDYWMSCNLNVLASKETLTNQVSLFLRRAITHDNIAEGFFSIGILHLNKHIGDKMLAPCEVF